MNRVKKFSLAAALVLLVAVAAAVIHHYQLKAAVARYRAELKAQGEPMELAQVIPPPVPDASNSVAAVREAFSRMNFSSIKVPNIRKMVAPGKALASWQQPEVIGEGEFTNSWAEFAAAVATNRLAVEQLHQVLERPKLDFQLDYLKEFELLLPHLAPMKYAAQLLEAATVLDLHRGDSDTATTNLLTLLALVQRNEGEATLVSHMVHILLVNIAVANTWEYLQSSQVTEAQLAALQKGWEQLNFFRDAEPAFTMDWVMKVDMLQKARKSHAAFVGLFGLVYSMEYSAGNSDWSFKNIKEKAQETASEIMWRSTWSHTDELRTLQNNQIILETLRAMQTNHSQFYKADYDAMQARLATNKTALTSEALFRALGVLTPVGFFDGEILTRSLNKILYAETARRVTVTAISLKRYQLRHGQLPETLAALVPEFVPSVPIDPFDGQPLKYRRHADGTFLLYSVAENGVDDGGDPTVPTAPGTRPNLQWQNPKARDWVWPQPASAAEAQAFLEQAGKTGD